MVKKMNETIGEKGGKRDRKRTILITLENKKKLKEYYKKKKELKLQKLEKEVRNLQLASFLVAIPLSLAGNTFDSIFHVRDEKKDERSQAKNLQTEKLHQSEKLELSETSIYIEDYQTNDRKFTDYGYPKTLEGKKVVPTTPRVRKETKEALEITEIPSEVTAKVSLKENDKKGIEKETFTIEKKEEQKVELIEEKQDTIPLPKAKIGKGMDVLATSTIFQKAQDKKIVAKYESKLKDIKQELKELIYEYNVLAKDSDDIYTAKEAENILYQLNMVIKKLEELREKIKVEVNSLEAEDYLTELVDGYIESFKEKKVIDEVKNSDLYIMIAGKLEEVTEKTETLNTKVETKKEELEIDEEKLQSMKEAYYDYDNFNNQLIALQYEQDTILKELEQKVKDSTSITEQVEYRMQLMTRQSKRLLQMLAIPMMIPGGRSAKAMATATAAYLYFMRNLMNPRLRERKYRIISVTDYGREIETNIFKIEDAISMIGKTSNKLESMIGKIESDFKEYIEEIPECKELLSNLNKLLRDLKEKEAELEKNKKEQEKLLEINNQKVKKIPKTEVM